MFTIAYLVIVALALVLVAQSYGSSGASPARFARGAYFIAAIVLGIICLEVALGVSLEYYWFTELGKTGRFLLALKYRAAIFVAVFLLATWFVGSNLQALCRSLQPFNIAAPWIAALVFSITLAMLATSLWIPLMGYFGATATGSIDPVFGNDLSFYLLQLPLYERVIGGLIATLVFTLAIWAVAVFLFGSMQTQPPSTVLRAGPPTRLTDLVEEAKRNVGSLDPMF